MSKETPEIIPSAQSVLYIDIGNSSVKVSMYDGKWDTLKRFTHDEILSLIDWINSNAKSVERIILSSVVEEATRKMAELVREIKLTTLETDDIPSKLLNYDTPKTLGMDRFLACYGAVSSYRSPVVVIDAGTACTLDYMTAGRVFYGGVIMPGLSLVERSMNIYAPALPEAARTIPAEWPGKSTETSLQWGLTAAFVDSVNAALERYRDTFGFFNLVLTGGDAAWLSTLIQEDLSVEPMLVFEGMKQFLEDFKTGRQLSQD